MTDVTEAPEIDLARGLGTVLRAHVERGRRAVEGLPGGPRGFQVLSMAAEEACSNQAEIARALGLDRTVMTYLVDDLETAGLVERRPDPADRRARQVVLTAEGERRHADLLDQFAAIDAEVLGGLDPDDAAVFRTLLTKVVGSLDGHSVDACTAVAAVTDADC